MPLRPSLFMLADYIAAVRRRWRVASPRPWLAFCSGFVGSCCEGRKGTSCAVIIGSGEAVMTRFSVAPIPPEDRSLHWSNFVSGIFFPMRASFSAPGTVSRNDRELAAGPNFAVAVSLGAGLLRSSKTASPRPSRRRSADHVCHEVGRRFSQGDNVLHCRKDGFFIQRGDLPYQFSHAQDNELWVLKLPTQMLKNR